MRGFTWLTLSLVAPMAAAPAVTHVMVAGRDVAIWKPAGPAPASGFPVIVFSHGYSGSNTQSTFLMEALASAGYFVLAPNHGDARTGWYPGKFLVDAVFRHPEEPFRKVDEWSDATYSDRAADVKAVLDAALGAENFEGVPVDPQKVGIAGHSLGGYTALGMAGAWPSWKDSRIKAVLALSPYSNPYIFKGDLPHLGVPVMYQGGTRDRRVTPTVRRVGGAYDVSSAPKYYVEFDGAGHVAWTDMRQGQRDLIIRYSVAFFDRYLKGMTSPDPLEPLTRAPPAEGVSDIRVKRP